LVLQDAVQATNYSAIEISAGCVATLIMPAHAKLANVRVGVYPTCRSDPNSHACPC
jgi:hypothetical protein